MPVKINIDETKCIVKITNHFNSKMGLLAAEILNDCNQYCKWDTGMLVASSYIHSRLDEGLLIWRTPYARRQYWEIQTAYTDNGNPKATWKWCEVAARERFGIWTKQAQRLVDGI